MGKSMKRQKPQKTNTVNCPQYSIAPFDDWDWLAMIPMPGAVVPEWLRLPTDDPEWLPEPPKLTNGKEG
jgi:hypothetical protein